MPMSLPTCVAMLCLGQAAPGPLDGFQTNYASIRVEMDFEYSVGRHDSTGGLWTAEEAHFNPTPGRELTGRWACDGTAEYYSFSSPGEVLAAARSKKPRREAGKTFFESHFVPKVEALWDGQTLVSHRHDKGSAGGDTDSSWSNLDARRIADVPAVLEDSRAPFYWGFTYTFPQIIAALYGGIEPTRRASVRAGHPVEVETYRKVFPGGGGMQLEISYDPSVGYLPRFARTFDINPGGKTIVKEMYLVEARPCKVGGFVPTEWLGAVFVADRIFEKHPDYSDETVLKPSGQVAGGHFVAKSLRDRIGPVALTDLKNVRSIGAMGGVVALRPGTTSITLPETKSLLGTRLTTPSRVMQPNVDISEVHRYDSPPPGGGGGPWYVAIAVVLVGASLVAWRAKSRRWPFAVVLALAAGSPGCGEVGAPVIKLTASFREDAVYFDPETTEVPITLLVRNDGNSTLKVLKIDGGCSCRKVSQENLPESLPPGKALAVSVRLGVKPMSLPQNARFDLETDHGTFSAGAAFFTLVSHQAEPDGGVQATLIEGQNWSFDWKHRSIFRDGEESDAEVKFPSAVEAVEVDRESGRVEGIIGFRYEDRTYKVTLKDGTPGLHKESLVVRGRGGKALLEAPILWDRVPFLSTAPKRVVLGDRPIRAFLRCPDESIELIRVRSMPEGIKAVIVSPREMLVSIDKGAPPVIDGEVDIETTAEGRPSLRVPVARFRSLITSTASRPGEDRP